MYDDISAGNFLSACNADCVCKDINNENEDYGIEDKKYDGQSKTPIVSNNKEDLSKLTIMNNQFLNNNENRTNQ